MKPLSEYPRPQLIRNSYLSLNGEWQYAITKSQDIPIQFDGNILVPFSPEKVMSGVNRNVNIDEFLYYHLSINIPKEYINDKVLLHFGAVDQICDLYINKKFVLHHIGGYLPFEVDIKPYLIEGQETAIDLRVRDLVDTSYHAKGKQRIKRGGIWYTQTTGIYMPVWLEGVSNTYIRRLSITPNIEENSVHILVDSDSGNISIEFDNKIYICKEKSITLKVNNPIYWTPENPHLYSFKIIAEKDIVESYFAMRKISLIKDSQGKTRIALNNKPYFMKGVLDQGYYEAGSLTPSSDQDYINDIMLMKNMGFNTLRKHIKVESLRWYYHCDRLGMIVWQDFVNGGEKYKISTISFPLITGIHRKDDNYSKFGRSNENGRNESIDEFVQTVKLLYNSPCICLWTIFNEGWGQFDSQKVLEIIKKHDKTRIFDHASGWHDQGISDTKSLHVYFKRFKMPKEKLIKNRAVILSECGGYTLPIKGHMFSKKKFGYKPLKNPDALINEYKKFIEKDIIKNIPLGLSAFIYTQLSDVEDELNGFVTYDRKVIKVNEKSIKEINELVKY